MPNDNVIEFRGARGGPRTDRGKRRSSMNSTRHGLYASRHLLRTEDREEFEAFGLGILADLGAVGPLEIELAEHVVGALWRLRRFRQYETTQQNVEIEKTDPLSQAVRAQRQWLERAQAHDAALTRLLFAGRVRRNDLQTAWNELKSNLLRDTGEHDDRIAALDDKVRRVINDVRGTLSCDRGNEVWSAIIALVRRVMPTDPADPYDLLEVLSREASRQVDTARTRLAKRSATT